MPRLKQRQAKPGMETDRSYDAVVVGAGMVGLSTALGLAGLGMRAAVVEGREPNHAPWDSNFDLRVSAINRATQNVYRHLQVWQAMCDLGVYAYRRMHVWDEHGSAQIHFDSADVGQANLGYIVENRVMLQALWQQAKQHANITFYCPATTRHIDRYDDRLVIDLEQEQISGKVLVGADGSNSWVRSQMGVANSEGDYQQSALVATVKLAQSHQDCAWQVFRNSGPLAFLPVRDNHCSIVWSTDQNDAARLLEMPVDAFNQALSAAVGNRFGEIALEGQRAVFPLRFRHSKNYVQSRIALVGDAAHTIHPLAGQGVNLGIMDSACLVQVIHQALATKRDPGCYEVLRQYERWRRGDNAIMLNSMTGINQLYRKQYPWLIQLRGFGMQISDTIEPLKRFFIHQAMGLQADLPTLAKP